MRRFEVGRTYAGYWFEDTEFEVVGRTEATVTLRRYALSGVYHDATCDVVTDEYHDVDTGEWIESVDYCIDDFLLAEPVD